MSGTLRLATNFGFTSLLSIIFILVVQNFAALSNILISGFLLPSILLTLLGRMVDHRQNHVLAKAVALTLSSTLLVLFFWLETVHFLAIAMTLCFWSGHLLHHESDQDHQDTKGSLINGLFMGALAAWIFIKIPDFFPTFLGTVLIALVLLNVFISTVYIIDNPPKEDMAPSFPQKGAFRDLKILNFQHGFSFALAGYFLGIQSSWTLPSWPWMAGAASVGILISRWNLPLLGFKRTLALIYVILFGLFMYSPEKLVQDERPFFLVFYLVLFSAERWSTTSLYKRSLSQLFAGYFAGVMILFSSSGLILGFYLQAELTSQWIPALLLISLMILNQTIYPERASTEAKNQPIQETPWGNAWISSSQDAPFFNLNTWLKYLQRTICEIFFSKIRVRGLENIQGIKGALLVANHPNTFFDPLLVSAIMPFSLKFLAKSTLWNIPILGSMLDHLGLIPVQRACDVSFQGRSENMQSLNKSASLLVRGQFILIFPEGVSEAGLTLKPVKTGAARILFSALEMTQWGKDIPIIPVGIDYEKPSAFRSSITIRIGTPISLVQHKESYLATPKSLVKETTRQIAQNLANLVPHLDSEEKESLVHNISKLYGSQLCQVMKTSDTTEARLAIAKAVNHYCEADPSSVLKFEERLETYIQTRRHLDFDENTPPLTVRAVFAYINAVCSPHMLGLVLHWLPYNITRKIVSMLPLDYVWQATAKLITGFIIYPLYYFILHMVFVSFFGALSGYILLTCTVLSGILALGHFNRYDFLFQPIETLWSAYWRRDTNQELNRMRTQLLQDLERFREAYAFHLAELENTSW